MVEIAGAIKDVGSSKKNKTGSWRTFKPIVTDKCTNCGICVMFCPEGCIKLGDKKAEIDYDYCKGCLICSIECPVKAINKELDKK